MTITLSGKRRGSKFRLALVLTLGCVALAAGARVEGARAEGEAGSPVKPAPRTTTQIGGVSVVLVSANNKLHAFVDRVADNAPAEDAAVSIALADGTDLKLERAGGGLFVGPFDRSGRIGDAFMVSVRSADGTGAVGADIAYDDLPETIVQTGSRDLQGKISIALVAAALGAAGATILPRWARNRRPDARRRPASVA